MDDATWWRQGVIYQIYPRSFYDTNNDGLGDLPGVVAKLDYLASLGVDAIWLSPFYPTPDKDFGYDVSDHCAVDPRFGTLADFDRLAAEAHARGIKVVLDLVLNHTSDQHPWFIESRASRQNPKRDWYIWRSPKAGGKPPNNWVSLFGGSAWELDAATGEMYLHLFCKEQPDVNWRNPAVRQAQLEVARFWLRRGVDGFRLDVFNAYYKDEALRDNPKLPLPIPVFGMKHVYDMDQPEMIPLLQELRRILDEAPGRYAVGETAFATAQKAASYCGADKLHAAFSFEFTGMGGLGAGSLRRAWIERKIQARDSAFAAAGVFPTTVMGNHDVPRPATRYSRDERDERPKLAMALLLTLRGTPFLYYGDEIGMRDIRLRRDQILDPLGKAFYPFHKGRDGCRSPMQWNDQPNAGFSPHAPWLPVHPNYTFRNVAAQEGDPDSILNLTRALIRLRKENPALAQGDQTFVSVGSQRVLAYDRACPEQTVRVLLNLSSRPAQVNLSGSAWNLLFSSLHRQPSRLAPKDLTLAPYEICLLTQ